MILWIWKIDRQRESIDTGRQVESMILWITTIFLKAGGVLYFKAIFLSFGVLCKPYKKRRQVRVGLIMKVAFTIFYI